MGTLPGILQRPAIAAAAVAVASFSADLHDKLRIPKISDACISAEQLNSSISDSFEPTNSSWVSHISVSKLVDLSFVKRVHVPIPNINYKNSYYGCNSISNCFFSSATSSTALLNSYQSAKLARRPIPAYSHGSSVAASSSEVLYRWHLPEPNAIDLLENSDCLSAKSKTVVVLLGWLGAKQKHLKKYAEWYTSRGFHVITFTFPMADILSYQVGGKTEEHIELLANHLADWLDDEYGKNLVFHTFSNTGWLTYGVILEKFQKQDPTLMARIKGCVVDSAPVAAPDPQVWASGFSAAFLKKRSVGTKGAIHAHGPSVEVKNGNENLAEVQPAVTETALLLVLEKFFSIVLNLPTINRRLSDVLGLLTSGQPNCPQLYIYSSADRVIPSCSVESFIEEQRRNGHEVRSCNFVSTPHVDHFRNDPSLYTSQLNLFLEDYVLTQCKSS